MTIVIERVEQVEVFINEGGSVTIKQNGYAGEDDDVVYFPVARIDDVVLALLALKAEAGQ